MSTRRTRSIFGLALVAVMLFSLIPVSAKDKDTQKSGSPAKPRSTTSSNSKLNKKENPELVGKRDINNNQINKIIKFVNLYQHILYNTTRYFH